MQAARHPCAPAARHPPRKPQIACPPTLRRRPATRPWPGAAHPEQSARCANFHGNSQQPSTNNNRNPVWRQVGRLGYISRTKQTAKEQRRTSLQNLVGLPCRIGGSRLCRQVTAMPPAAMTDTCLPVSGDLWPLHRSTTIGIRMPWAALEPQNSCARPTAN